MGGGWWPGGDAHTHTDGVWCVMKHVRATSYALTSLLHRDMGQQDDQDHWTTVVLNGSPRLTRHETLRYSTTSENKWLLLASLVRSIHWQVAYTVLARLHWRRTSPRSLRITWTQMNRYPQKLPRLAASDRQRGVASTPVDDTIHYVITV